MTQENDRAQGAYVIVAGKTGGHIFPGIALAREIRARRPAAPVVFVGTPGVLEARLVGEAGFALESVRASGFVGRSLGQRLKALADLPAGFFQARRILRAHRARAVAAMGGYVSVPVLAAATTLGLPTIVHDSDAEPGLATRLANRFATATAVGLAQANARLARPGVVTGTPVREEFFRIAPLDSRAPTRRLLVFGGSQGSAALNRAMVEAAPALSAAEFEVVHQTGERNLEATRALYGPLPPGWRLAAFLPRLYDEVAWADLVVSRSGAMTLAELAAAGRPALLVPFAASAHGHQSANARAFVGAGAAVSIDEGQFNGASLVAAVTEIFSSRTRLVQMGALARFLAVPGAAGRLAELLFETEAAA